MRFRHILTAFVVTLSLHCTANSVFKLQDSTLIREEGHPTFIKEITATLKDSETGSVRVMEARRFTVTGETYAASGDSLGKILKFNHMLRMMELPAAQALLKAEEHPLLTFTSDELRTYMERHNIDIIDLGENPILDQQLVETAFIVRCFAHPEVMKYYLDSVLRNTIELVEGRFNFFGPGGSIRHAAFEKSNRAGFLFYFKGEALPCGYGVVGASGKPGIGTAALLIDPSIWQKGIGHAIIEAGLSTYLPHIVSSKAPEFGNGPLEKVEATVTPTNVPSAKLLDLLGVKDDLSSGSQISIPDLSVLMGLEEEASGSSAQEEPAALETPSNEQSSAPVAQAPAGASSAGSIAPTSKKVAAVMSRLSPEHVRQLGIPLGKPFSLIVGEQPPMSFTVSERPKGSVHPHAFIVKRNFVLDLRDPRVREVTDQEEGGSSSS